MNPAHRAWTPEEDDAIRAAGVRNLPTGGRRGELIKLADALDRTPAAVRVRASRIGAQSQIDWTPEEDAAILDMSRTAHEVAVSLGRRTQGAVENRRRRLLRP